MKKFPTIISENQIYVLLKDYQDFVGYVILYINSKSGEMFTKADKRLKGDIKMATNKFFELYGYNCKLEHKSFQELV